MRFIILLLAIPRVIFSFAPAPEIEQEELLFPIQDIRNQRVIIESKPVILNSGSGTMVLNPFLISNTVDRALSMIIELEYQPPENELTNKFESTQIGDIELISLTQKKKFSLIFKSFSTVGEPRQNPIVLRNNPNNIGFFRKGSKVFRGHIYLFEEQIYEFYTLLVSTSNAIVVYPRNPTNTNSGSERENVKGETAKVFRGQELILILDTSEGKREWAIRNYNSMELADKISGLF